MTVKAVKLINFWLKHAGDWKSHTDGLGLLMVVIFMAHD